MWVPPVSLTSLEYSFSLVSDYPNSRTISGLLHLSGTGFLDCRFSVWTWILISSIICFNSVLSLWVIDGGWGIWYFSCLLITLLRFCSFLSFAEVLGFLSIKLWWPGVTDAPETWYWCFTNSPCSPHDIEENWSFAASNLFSNIDEKDDQFVIFLNWFWMVATRDDVFTERFSSHTNELWSDSTPNSDPS